MKLLPIILSIFAITSVYSQEKYQGLLWKISGNGLEKNSYLYGNMHVSGRIAFHLGEEFFDAINEADAIALESNPIMWLDEILDSEYGSDYLGSYGINNQHYNGFYQEAFKLKKVDNNVLGNEISTDHYMANWLLYRENKANSDFEEETFLDMFIYQVASKNNKPIYSLEDFKHNSKLVKLASIPDMENKETPEWVKKLTKDKSAFEILMDAYRSQDLDMIDSLQAALSSDNYLKYMLYERNIIMANQIDSIIKQNISLFSGIGAAHLPKKNGVIALLRAKGYTAEALPVTISKKSKSQIEENHKKKRLLPYNSKFQSDFFSLNVPGKMYETPSHTYQRLFFSPELTNGSFFLVNQLSTYHYFKSYNNGDFQAKIDSLLFENVPGKIISKKEFEKNGFKALDVLNKTKSGNYQRYQFVFTPLNILIFKMGGKDEFVKNEGDNFFNTITLTPIAKDWKKVQPLKSDFEVEVPNYYHFKNNTKMSSLYDHTELEAYDANDNNFYYLKRASLFDTQFIEQDSFELNRIADMFLKELKIDSSTKNMNLKKQYPELIAHSTLPDSSGYISLKIVIKGAYYYLLANVSPTQKTTNPFFESFTLKDFSYTFEFKEKSDSSMFFTVTSNHLLPNDYEQVYDIASDKKAAKKKTKDTSFEYKIKNSSFYSENFERIDLEFIKEHQYKEFEHIDSLWSNEIKYIQKTNHLVILDSSSTKKGDIFSLDIVFGDTNSTRTIIAKIIVKHASIYVLKTTGDSISQPSKFISQFFETFTPFDTLIGSSVLADKSEMFFNAIYSNDSIEKERALESAKNRVIFNKDDGKYVDQLMQAISNYPFGSDYIEAKEQLIMDLGRIDNDRIIPFLESLYPTVEDTAMYQIAILRALIRQKEKEALNKFIKLLDYDIPLGSNKDDIKYLFRAFEDSLELASTIFPRVLDFTFVADYKKPIYELLAQLIDSNHIKPKQYAKFYKQIVREAKIELKSQISYEQAEGAKEKDKTYYYSSYKNKGNDFLIIYTKLLLPFYNKKEVKTYFNKLLTVQDYKLLTDVYCNMITNNISVDKSVWNYLANDVINYAYLYQELAKIKRLDLFPEDDNLKQNIAKSMLYSSSFNFSKDTLEFITSKEITIQNKVSHVYFFKSKKPKDDNWSLDYIGIHQSKDNLIQEENLVKEKNNKIAKDKDIDEFIKEKVKSIEIIGHKRAREEDDNSSYFDFF